MKTQIKKPIKVTVCMITYNHENYIRQAVENVMMQETSFAFQLLISDDCSTDNTRKIVLDLKKEYPDKICLKLNNKNLGMRTNFITTLQACGGQYIALLEGDDYWVDPKKLETQVVVLDKNAEIAYCSHNVKVDYQDKDKKSQLFNDNKLPKFLSCKDLIDKWTTHTSSIIFRKHLIDKIPDWIHSVKNMDYALGLLLSSYGEVYYLDDIMSVYRKHKNGFSAKFAENIAFYHSSIIDLLSKFDNFTNYKYSKEILNRINKEKSTLQKKNNLFLL